MNLFIDEDSVHRKLVALLRKAGHHVVTTLDVDLSGASDVRNLTHAVLGGLVVLTRNYRDFRDLHELIGSTGGEHTGILITASDNDPTRDMTPHRIVSAIAKLEESGVPIANHLYILNHWR